jgi:NADH dehydrogenase
MADATAIPGNVMTLRARVATPIVAAHLPRIVIVGGGFGGLQAAKALRREQARITLIDRSNYHLFQPLLYQVATAGLSPADIASPIRGILKHQKNTEVMLGEVIGVDPQNKSVLLRDRTVPYDYLILATGARHSYFGKEDWEKYAPGLKSIDDATRIRRKILLAFEAAELETDKRRQSELLTFILVGGGPTGVELAGSIAELAHSALKNDFRHIDSRSARILLLEAGPRILSAFPEDLSKKAYTSLVKLGVDVRTGARVESVDSDGVVVSGERIRSQSVIWSAGVQASPIARWLPVKTDRAGRVFVSQDLSIPGHPEIFVVGDAALVKDTDDKPLPGVAPVAMQEGRFVGAVIAARLKGKTEMESFRYKDKGNLATIGRSSAIAEIRGLKLSGFIAWITWLFVHLFFLIGFRNRLLVMFQWTWAYITFQRGARLITLGEKQNNPEI